MIYMGNKGDISYLYSFHYFDFLLFITFKSNSSSTFFVMFMKTTLLGTLNHNFFIGFHKDSFLKNRDPIFYLLHKIERAIQFNFTSLLSAREGIITGNLVPTNVCPT